MKNKIYKICSLMFIFLFLGLMGLGFTGCSQQNNNKNNELPSLVNC